MEPHPVERLVVEWPEGEAEPTKYWLSTLPGDTPLAVLVDVIKLRWRVERDDEESKSELGLAHCEGRGWLRIPSSRQPLRRSLRVPRPLKSEQRCDFLHIGLRQWAT